MQSAIKLIRIPQSIYSVLLHVNTSLSWMFRYRNIKRAILSTLVMTSLMFASNADATLYFQITSCDAGGNCLATWSGGTPGLTNVITTLPAPTSFGPSGSQTLHFGGVVSITDTSGNSVVFNPPYPCVVYTVCEANPVEIGAASFGIGPGGGGGGGGGGVGTPLLDGSSWNN